MSLSSRTRAEDADPPPPHKRTTFITRYIDTYVCGNTCYTRQIKNRIKYWKELNWDDVKVGCSLTVWKSGHYKTSWKQSRIWAAGGALTVLLDRSGAWSCEAQWSRNNMRSLKLLSHMVLWKHCSFKANYDTICRAAKCKTLQAHEAISAKRVRCVAAIVGQQKSSCTVEVLRAWRFLAARNWAVTLLIISFKFRSVFSLSNQDYSSVLSQMMDVTIAVRRQRTRLCFFWRRPVRTKRNETHEQRKWNSSEYSLNFQDSNAYSESK